jgi:radical SAM family uncharacterized protein/radical SAM-linked protein
MSLRDVLNSAILPAVARPSRYLGTELNSANKDPARIDVRVALAFPDLYDLGLGNLGVHILYAILNDLPWCWAERVYAPAPDMETALRTRGLPLFLLESKDPVAQADLIGFSLQSELTYTSVLNILDLSGLPLRSQRRGDHHPVVFAGGPSAVNPEPLAPFIDFFVIGDGEDIIVEIAERARGLRGSSRTERLDAFAALPGVYVPERYPFETLPDGGIVPREGAPKVVRRVVKDLDAAPFPSRYIVPFAQLVHDRIGIEVLRGCTHGCRFCQAGMIGRPVRARSLETIDALLKGTLADTGYEEVSLLSLSTCDYPHVRTLLEQSAGRAHADHAAVSVPSLRLDTFSVELADAVAGVRRSGLTFAPEAGTPRLRSVINKWFEDGVLLEVVAEAFKRGWEHVKCYFMIGLPTERDEDVEAIVDLCLRTLDRARAVTRRARLFTGIATCVPKPFTPFQWAAQIGLEETRRRQAILAKGFKRHPGIKFGRHAPESTFIEGLLARGDRRAADLIEAAFRHGARLESSSEHLHFQAWLDAIQEVGYDAENAFRERARDERLPWDHIDVLIPKMWFQVEWDRAMTLARTPDCRAAGCNQCGLRDRVPGLCAAMQDVVRRAAAEDARASLTLPERVEPPPVQRLRFRVGRTEEARFLSNLEWMSAWARALRRARAPLSYSQGFHSHPKITFATAPPVGEESEGDYMDVVLRERIEPAALLDRLRAMLPRGFHAYEAIDAPLNAPSLMSAVIGFDYTLYAESDPARIEARIREVLAAGMLSVERKGRPGVPGKRGDTTMVDIRPMIHALALRGAEANRITIDFSTRVVNGKLAKPREIIEALGLNPAATRVLKRATQLSAGG